MKALPHNECVWKIKYMALFVGYITIQASPEETNTTSSISTCMIIYGTVHGISVNLHTRSMHVDDVSD